MKKSWIVLSLLALLLLAGCAKKDDAARLVSATVRTPGGEDAAQTYQYDETGRLTAIEGPDGTTTFDYDIDYAPPAGGAQADFNPPEVPAFGGALDEIEAVSVCTPDGQTELYAYGRLMECRRADGSLLRAYTRAENGLITQVCSYDESGHEQVEEYRYIGDDYGTVMEADIFVDGEEIGYLGYDYDLGKVLTKLTWYAPDETPLRAVAYTWGDDGRLLRETWYEGTSELQRSVTYDYE